MSQYPAVIALSDLNGSNGFQFDGAAAHNAAGFPGASAGDVNNDGFADLIVGAHAATPNGISFAGEAYVIFGSAAGPGAEIDPSFLDGHNGFRIPGLAANDVTGLGIGTAGDVNGDGITDLIVSATGADPAGSTYIIYGHAGDYLPVFDLATIDGGAAGYRIDGEVRNDRAGRAAATAGDVNGDGIDDIIIGAYLSNPDGVTDAGSAYVVFGKAGISTPLLNLAALNGSNGFEISGLAAQDWVGFSVASAGDVNGDGFADVIVGAYGADPGGNDGAGAAYVVFGRGTTMPAQVPVDGLDGSNGFKLSGVAAGDHAGISVASAGDINGDGLKDIIVGAYLADPNGHVDAGASYVVFGTTAGFPADIDLSTLDGTKGFRIDGEFDKGRSGRSVASAGDINGDGFDDLVIGAYLAPPAGRGASYVVFGKASGFDATLDLSSLDGSNGFEIDGEFDQGRSGISAASIGDFNHDGLSDLVISAPFADANGLANVGVAHVLFGRLPDTAVARIGTSADQTLVGGNQADTLAGEGGNDALWGHDGDDVLDGGTGADSMQGGTGDDTYVVDQVGDVVLEAPGEGTDTVQASITYGLGDNIEWLVLTGTAAIDGTGNALDNVITGNKVDNVLDGGAGLDHLLGGNGNDVLTGGTGADTLDGGANNDRLIGGVDGAADSLIGGNGSDTYVVGEAGEIIVENAGDAGIDTVETTLNSFITLAVNIEALTFTGAGSFVGRGNAGDNILTGGAGNDRFVVDSGGADQFRGGTGTDIVDYRTSSGVTINLTTNVHGGAAAGDGFISIETIYGSSTGDDTMVGSASGNRFDGWGGNDILTGVDGNDILNGGDGSDTITGGLGADVLNGGAGADFFVFQAAADSAGLRDRIQDFVHGLDQIDVTAIDASTTQAGVQHFAFIGTAAFTDEGQIRAYQSGANTIIEFNTTGTLGYEMRIQLDSFTVSMLMAGDFIV